ncbi:MAG: Crp/Fnr family transcriptional regulator [Bacillota bacterium]
MSAHLFLRKIRLFSDLDDQELEQIASIVITRKCKKRTILFTEGEPGDTIYFVKSGRVKIFKTTEDGREQILRLIEPGEVMAEAVLFESGGYPASAEVMEDSEICLIRNPDLEQLVMQHGEIAIRLIRVLSRRLKEAQHNVRDLALKDAYARTASILLKMVQNSKVTPHGIEVKPDLSRQELANMVGTSRETVSRILSDFQQQKILVAERNKIVLLDKEKLGSWV